MDPSIDFSSADSMVVAMQQCWLLGSSGQYPFVDSESALDQVLKIWRFLTSILPSYNDICR